MKKDIIELVNSLDDKLKMINSEEGTKMSLVLPLLDILGYDVHDASEIRPEYTADIPGIKAGEKVDYAVFDNNQPIMIIECKYAGATLRDNDISQLFRYFTATDCRIGILTNGIRYQFYTDLVSKNRMDIKPFMIIDLLNDDVDNIVDNMMLFSKKKFDVGSIVNQLADTKYAVGIKQVLSEEMSHPSDEFIRFLLSKAAPSRKTLFGKEKPFSDKVIQKYRPLVYDILSGSNKPEKKIDSVKDKKKQKTGGGIITTERELKLYSLVKDILDSTVDTNRIIYNDKKSSFGIYLDKPVRGNMICNYYENNKDLGISGTYHKLANIEDVLHHAPDLIAKVEGMLK